MLIRQMNGNMAENSRSGDFSYKADPSTWRDVPPFEYEAPPLAQAMAMHTPSVWLLAVWLVLGLLSVLRTRSLRLD
jgi:hypothetical protein